jgi:hypothetical protein
MSAFLNKLLGKDEEPQRAQFERYRGPMDGVDESLQTALQTIVEYAMNNGPGPGPALKNISDKMGIDMLGVEMGAVRNGKEDIFAAGDFRITVEKIG